MTDLIARLEEHLAMHEEGVREQDDGELPRMHGNDDMGGDAGREGGS